MSTHSHWEDYDIVWKFLISLFFVMVLGIFMGRIFTPKDYNISCYADNETDHFYNSEIPLINCEAVGYIYKSIHGRNLL